MLQVLGRATSLNVRKVLWVCQELEITYELQQWGSAGMAPDTPAFRALNPNALVPVIRDGNFHPLGIQHDLPLPGEHA